MKKIFLILVGVLFPLLTHAQAIVLLDEGINTDQPLSTPSNALIEQRCRSVPTNFNPVDRDVPFVSLCRNLRGFHYGIDIAGGDVSNAAEYEDERTFQVRDLVNGGFIGVTIDHERPSDGHPLRHGNYVSNAAWDFTTSLTHIPFTVFGITRINNQQSVVASLRGDAADELGVPEEPIGTFIRDALTEVSLGGLIPGEFEDVGAVNLSVIIRSASGSTSAEDLCANGFGQNAINRLARKGIVLVNGLDNNDLPSDRITWPACLDGVIKVGSTVAFQNQNRPDNQIGIGANGLDFFAEDDINNVRGNSFAAPRVAAAYSLLHRAFRLSTVAQKTEALNNASNLTSRYTLNRVDGTSEVIRRRSIRFNQIDEAIEFLGSNFVDDLFPEQLIASADLDIELSSSIGTFFEPNTFDTRFEETIDFSALRPITALAATSEGEEASATLPVLSPRRDVIFQFTGIRGGDISTGYNIGVGSRNVFRTGASVANTSQRFEVILRREFIQEGENEFFVSPVNTSETWGISDVLISYLPDIRLTVNETDTTTYGYEFSPSRFSGARAAFELSDNQMDRDVTISMQGFDIDVADETAVFINGTFLGHLNAGTSDTFSEVNTFVVRSDLLLNGANFLEFVQRETGIDWDGFEDEKWAVRNILVEVGESSSIVNLLPILLNFLLDEEE